MPSDYQDTVEVDFYEYKKGQSFCAQDWQCIFIRIGHKNVSHKVSKKTFANFIKALDLVETEKGSGIYKQKAKSNEETT